MRRDLDELGDYVNAQKPEKKQKAQELQKLAQTDRFTLALKDAFSDTTILTDDVSPKKTRSFGPLKIQIPKERDRDSQKSNTPKTPNTPT